ncbi:MAG: hypothetical protein II010_04905 [Oscillospiraceae bacterium]|nr:hypothetical protein [Oscillospiraceae bacterium]
MAIATLFFLQLRFAALSACAYQFNIVFSDDTRVRKNTLHGASVRFTPRSGVNRAPSAVFFFKKRPAAF